MRISWCALALLAGATAWAQTADTNRNDKKARPASPLGEVTPKLWLENHNSDKGDLADREWHIDKMTTPQMLAIGMLPSPLGEPTKPKAKIEPIPTEWPDLKMGPIPTTWPKLKMLLIESVKKETESNK